MIKLHLQDNGQGRSPDLLFSEKALSIIPLQIFSNGHGTFDPGCRPVLPLLAQPSTLSYSRLFPSSFPFRLPQDLYESFAATVRCIWAHGICLSEVKPEQTRVEMPGARLSRILLLGKLHHHSLEQKSCLEPSMRPSWESSHIWKGRQQRCL